MNNVLQTDYKSLAEEVRKNLETLPERGVNKKRNAFSIFLEMRDAIDALYEQGFTTSDIAKSLKTTKLGAVLTEGTIQQYVQRVVGKRKGKSKKNRKPMASGMAVKQADNPVTKSETNAPVTAPVMAAKPVVNETAKTGATTANGGFNINERTEL